MANATASSDPAARSCRWNERESFCSEAIRGFFDARDTCRVKRIALVLAVVVALVALVAPLAPLAAAAPDAGHPALRVLDKAPLVLRGTGFERWERVKVTVVAKHAHLVRRALASRLGTFVVRFDTVVDSCNGARAATAVGARGSKASIVLERPWQRECTEPSGAP